MHHDLLHSFSSIHLIKCHISGLIFAFKSLNGAYSTCSRHTLPHVPHLHLNCTPLLASPTLSLYQQVFTRRMRNVLVRSQVAITYADWGAYSGYRTAGWLAETVH